METVGKERAGTASSVIWLLGTVERFTGNKINELYMSGGGGLSPFMASIFANVLEERSG